jgi:AcrR family transcriptional regulator
MPPNPTATRARLVAAAEELFAERGIDAVSLREINAAAGQRNSAALQYHFADRDGLLLAVLAKHTPEVESRRHALLDQHEASVGDGGTRDDALRVLAGALVRPSATKLADPDGGRFYLRIMAQLVYRPEFGPSQRGRDDRRDSINRWRALVGPLLPEATVTRLHRRFTAIRITFVELARRAEEQPGKDDRLFVSHLVDLVAAVLDAPMSRETERLLAERATRPGRR